MNVTPKPNPLKSDLDPSSLHPAMPDEFFAPRPAWARAGGVILVVGFLGMVLLSSVLTYKVTVTAPAFVRPGGELRIVQAASEGQVQRILVEQNQYVEEDSVLAYVDDSRLQTTASQLESTIQSATQRMDQVRAQINALEGQIAAETDLLNRSVSGAQAEVSLNERSYQERRLTTEADVRGAQAAVDFARDELSRFQTLGSQGLISDLQVKEKETNLESAEARLQGVEAALNPSAAEVEMAEERVVQERARGEAVLARSRQERERLLQRQVEIQAELDTDREELREIEAEIDQTAIRAPVSGVIQELTLRNRGQVVRPGDLVARIAPGSTSLEVKAFVAPRDIGQVALGQSVQMRVSACPFPDFGTLRGSVVAVSPDAVPAQATGARGFRGNGAAAGYEVTVRPDTLTLEISGRTCAILAGMEGSAQIISREETVLRFVLRKARLVTDVRAS